MYFTNKTVQTVRDMVNFPELFYQVFLNRKRVLQVQIEFNLNEYSRKRAIFEAIDDIPYIYGSTNTADAIETMRSTMFTARNGDRRGVPNIGVIITDGISNINAQRTIPEAEYARREDIHIYTIGIGLTDTRELDAMASVPAAENSFAVNDFDELQGLENRVFSALCPGRIDVILIIHVLSSLRLVLTKLIRYAILFDVECSIKMLTSKIE